MKLLGLSILKCIQLTRVTRCKTRIFKRDVHNSYKNLNKTTAAVKIPHYTVRPMKREDIPEVLKLKMEHGVFLGTYSLDAWFSYDPKGFYVAVTDDGMVLGSCSGVLQNENVACIGLYVVNSAYRKHGVGTSIWNAVMKRVGSRNAGLSTITEHLENLRDRAGFPVQTSWSTTAFYTKSIDMTLFTANNLKINVQRLTLEDIDTLNRVISYDEDVLGFSRNNLVPLLCNLKDSITVVATSLDRREIRGYGNIRKNIRTGAVVGPLYADSAEIAERILYELLKAFPIDEMDDISMISIDCNAPGMKMMDKLGILPSKEMDIFRLYRKEEVRVKYEKIFCLHDIHFSLF